jgi:hypothetical protein
MSGTEEEVDRPPRFAQLGDGGRLSRPQVLVHEGDRHAAPADRGGDSLNRAEPDVAAGEDTWNARLE